MSDQPKIEITLDGAPCTIEAGSTGALLLQDAVKKDGVVAMRVNGEPWDLERQIPAGAVDGGRLRYRGRGEYGSNGGERGDLVVTTRVGSHPHFKRDGADVRMDLPISMYEAALGAEIVVTAPNGKDVKLKIPAGTQPGKTFRFKGMGAPDVKRKGQNGSFYVKVVVDIPTDLTDKEREALEQLRDHDHRELRSGMRKAR